MAEAATGAPDAAPDAGYYVYGVVPASGGTSLDVAGIDGTEVAYVVHGELAAAVGRVSLDRPPGRSAELRAHGAVLDALARLGPVVPAQFGGMLGTAEDVVAEVLTPDHDRLRELLASLRGTGQFRLRATYVTDVVLAEVVQADPRIAELRRRTRDLPSGHPHPDAVRLGELVSAAMEAKRGEDAAWILERTREWAEAESVQPGAGLDHLVTVALLVRDERVDGMEAALEQLAEAVHERIRLALVGPMAPYDFVEGAGWV